MIRFILNGRQATSHLEDSTPLLWALRDELVLTGTKFGCGTGLCGACTVNVNGEAVRSCVFPMSLAQGQTVTTIEGLSPDGQHPLQIAWIAEQVPQCGYCQSGQLMQAAALLAHNPHPTRAMLQVQIGGNENRKTVLLGGKEQLAVGQTRPSSLIRGRYYMPRQ